MTNDTIISFYDFTKLPLQEMYAHLVETTNQLHYAHYENAHLRQKLFGRKSEKSKGFEQHQTPLPGFDRLFDETSTHEEEPDHEDSVDSDELQVESESEVPKKKGGRKPLPEHLPRERRVHDLKESDKICACGHLLHKIGEEISEQLDYIPATVKVIQHVRFKYACKACENGVTTAPVPLHPIPKSMATATLLAQVFVSKFDDHLPLYRQAEIWQRLGVDLNRATLSNWVIKAGSLCQPLVDLLRAQIVESLYAQADETTVTLLKQTKPRQNSYMWVYKTGYGEKQSIVYDFQESRSGHHASAFLDGFKGYLQGDAYSGYNDTTSRPDIIRVGCMAHARRKFMDIVKMAPNKYGYAHKAVEKIKRLYEIEAKIKKEKLSPDQVKLYRERYSKPLLDHLKKWLDDLKPKAPPKGPLGKAVSYVLNNWADLTRYLDDGRLEIDNNACERAVRPFTVGRKNWLFMGNMAGARGGAALYSLIETAKANGIDSFGYLCHVLEMIPKLPADQLDQLLPWNCPSQLQNTFKQAA